MPYPVNYLGMNNVEFRGQIMTDMSVCIEFICSLVGNICQGLLQFYIKTLQMRKLHSLRSSLVTKYT